jgi:hypothetical protein
VLDVDVGRLSAVARIEKEPVGTNSEDRGHRLLARQADPLAPLR